MLTAEIKVNGALIAHVYVHNTGAWPTEGLAAYYWEIYMPGEDMPGLKSGYLEHRRDLTYGWAELLNQVLENWRP